MAIVAAYPYPGGKASLGGVGQAVYQLVNALARRNEADIHVIACTPDVSDYTAIEGEANTLLHFYPPQHRGYETLLLYRGRRAFICRILGEIKPDLVHAQEPPAEILAGIQSPYPHIVTVHGLFRNHYRAMVSNLGWRGRAQWGIPALIEAYNFCRMQNLIAITEEIAAVARRASPDVRIFRIPNPIDEAYFAECPQENGAPIVLYSGLVRYLKGVDLFLEAARRVRRAVPEARFRLAGSLEWEPIFVAGLREEYADLFESGVASFIGLCDVKEMVKEYARCAVLCLPSRAESAPMVIAEAMAVGRPVVATRVGGVPEMVEEGVTGRLCPPGDPEALARCLVGLLGDAGMRREMGARGRGLAYQRYRADAIAGATMDAYREVLAGSSERVRMGGRRGR